MLGKLLLYWSGALFCVEENIYGGVTGICQYRLGLFCHMGIVFMLCQLIKNECKKASQNKAKRNIDQTVFIFLESNGNISASYAYI